MLEAFEYKPGDICVLADIVMPDPADGSKSDSGEDDDSESRLPKKVNILIHMSKLKGLKWLGSDTGPGQYRFLFFSGHGHHQPHKPSPTANQCIMPEDVINQRLSGSVKPGTKFTAVFDAVFDCCYSGGMLETALQNGPGEDIISSGEPNSKGRRQHGIAAPNVPSPRVDEQQCDTEQVTSPSEDVVMTDPPVQTSASSETPDPTQTSQSSQSIAEGTIVRQNFSGNFLGLPTEVDVITGTESNVPGTRNVDFIQTKHEKTKNLGQAGAVKVETKATFYRPQLWAVWSRDESSAPLAESSQPVSEFTCQRSGVSSTMGSFTEGCNIMCWAACRKVESALEDKINAGRFTEAFTEFLTRPRNSEGTQLPRSTQVLISHLRVKFTEYNKEAEEKGWAKQHPKVGG
ncbi:unnamed protein product [Rhizoctonia solani]|uniref:ICE-like protease (Caspase) p20 domain protein n=1 Tax=Rhizoctonia solani TaxID=456999 RepID=A0A8H3AZB0_9AGAM|nr:unnamed protein product [Rhizoctonia solani]